MQLIQIRPSRNNDKVWLTFDDGSFIPFKIDDVVVYKIKIGPVDNYDFLCELSAKFLINNYALRQIAISPKIRQILLPKLKNKIYYFSKKYNFQNLNAIQIIDQNLDYLEGQGWLDKNSYAKFLIKKHHQKSKQYLQQLFSFYNLDKTLLSSNDKENLKKILQKKISNLSNPLDLSTKNKLIRSMVQKGFAYSDIKFVIDEILSVG